MLVARVALRALGASVRARAATVPASGAAAYVLTEGQLDYTEQPPQFVFGPTLEALEELSEPQGKPFSLACPPPGAPRFRAGFAFVEGCMRDFPGSAQDMAGSPPPEVGKEGVCVQCWLHCLFVSVAPAAH